MTNLTNKETIYVHVLEDVDDDTKKTCVITTEPATCVLIHNKEHRKVVTFENRSNAYTYAEQIPEIAKERKDLNMYVPEDLERLRELLDKEEKLLRELNGERIR